MTTPSNKYLKVMYVFLASPNDLSVERRMFPEVIEKVNQIKAKAKGILLEAVGWEDTLPGKGRPQEKINEDVIKSHLIVMLLWKRWGSPTGKYSSGFEEEYELACSNEKEIWLYFRTISDEMLADPGEQLKRVLEFRNKIEAERRFLFRRYDDEHGWKEQFIEVLCRWLDGLEPSPSELESLVEYTKRIEQLEKELEKTRIGQIKAAQKLGIEAEKHANSGHITKAEEYFAKAIAI